MICMVLVLLLMIILIMLVAVTTLTGLTLLVERLFRFVLVTTVGFVIFTAEPCAVMTRLDEFVRMVPFVKYCFVMIVTCGVILDNWV